MTRKKGTYALWPKISDTILPCSGEDYWIGKHDTVRIHTTLEVTQHRPPWRCMV